MVAVLPSKCKPRYRTNASGSTRLLVVESAKLLSRSPGPPNPHKDLGRRLRIARDRAGLTQEQAAERLGITYSAIGQWERGNGSVTALNLFLAAQTYSASLDWLVFGMKGPIEKRVAALPASLRELTMSQITNALENAERAYRTNPQIFGETVVRDEDERLTSWSAADKIKKTGSAKKPGKKK